MGSLPGQAPLPRPAGRVLLSTPLNRQGRPEASGVGWGRAGLAVLGAGVNPALDPTHL